MSGFNSQHLETINKREHKTMMNVWFTPSNNTYHIRYDGKHYTRSSYTAAKELIDTLLPNLVAVAQHNVRTA